jgi:hypothetical protein
MHICGGLLTIQSSLLLQGTILRIVSKDKALLSRVARIRWRRISVCWREVPSALARQALRDLSRERTGALLFAATIAQDFEGCCSGERRAQDEVKATKAPLRLYLWLLHVATLPACLHHLPTSLVRSSGKTARQGIQRRLKQSALLITQCSTAASSPDDKLLALHPTTLHVLLAFPRPLH